MIQRAVIERLEDRALLSTIAVTNTNDTGSGSLRAAVASAAAGDTISFGDLTTPTTITLTSGQIEITKDLNIVGPGARLLTISGNDNSRIFLINDGNDSATSNVSISGLTLAHGNGSGEEVPGSNNVQVAGGAIFDFENLTLTACTVSANTVAGGGGGADFVLGTSLIDSCTFSGNTVSSAGSNGGAFILSNGTVNVQNSTLSGNTTGNSGGGAIVQSNGSLTFTNSTVVNNIANGANGGGGLRVTGSGSTLSLFNTIVAGNTNSIGNDLTKSSGGLVGNNNVIGDAASAGGLTNGTNGNIVGVGGAGVRTLSTIINTTLANNGGPTETHLLAAGSVAIDAGNAVRASTFASDQRGVGYNRFNGTVDIGAVENGVTAPTFTGVTVLGLPAQVNNSTTLKVTVLPGTNRLLVVSASGSALSGQTDITGVTFNGTPMTLGVKEQDGIAVDTFWYLVLGDSTSATTGNVVATVSNGTLTALGATAFEGADQTTPINHINQGHASGGSASLSVTSATGDVVMDIFDTYDTTAVPVETPNAGQAVVQNIDAPSGSLNGFYQTSIKPGAASVSLGWTSTAGSYIQAAISINQQSAANQAPAVDLNAGGAGQDVTTAFTEQTPVLIAPLGTVTDADSANLASLTVTLAARPDGNAVESLSLNTAATTAASGLTVSYTASTGVLSITGSASVATYQSILQGILYNDTSDTPTTTSRSITVVANDGTDPSATQTVTLTVAASNDAPVVDLNGVGAGQDVTTGFTEQTPVLIAPLGTVNDVDSVNLASLTATLSARPDGNAVESLSLNTAATTAASGLTVSYTAATGVLSITGSASVATYQSILQGILYNDTSDTPTTTSRSLTVVANDGTSPSVTQTVTLTVAAVNDPPAVDLNGVGVGQDVTTAFTEQTAVLIAPLATLSDVDSANLTSLTLTLSARPDGDAIESLSLNTAATTAASGLTVVYTAATGVLSITGSASVATYQSILQGILYNDTSDTPTTTSRSVTVVSNDGTDPSAIQTVTLTVTAVNDPPAVDLNGAGAGQDLTTTFTKQTPLVIAPAGTVTDADSANLTSMTVTLTARPDGDAVESLTLNTAATTAASGLTVSYTAATGVLSFAGSASVSTYQTILQGILYVDTSATPTTTNRSITVVANDGTDPSATQTVTVSIYLGNTTVTSVLSGATVVTVGSILTGPISTLDVQFSFDMDATNGGTNSVTNVANWALYRNGAIVSNPISGITYNAGTRTATVTFTQPLTDGGFQLVALHTIQDAVGGALVGSANGAPAVDFLRNFFVAQVVSTPGGPQPDVAPVLYGTESASAALIGPLTTPVTSTLQVFDADTGPWAGATIQITAGYQNGQDILGFVNTAKITSSWDASTGTLTLSGADSLSNYRAALQHVTYHNSSASPDTVNTRTISFTANDGFLSSNTVTRDITVRANSANPTLTGLGGTVTFTKGNPPVTVAPNIASAHPDNLNIASATVSLTNWQPGDRLTFANTFALQHSFTENFADHTALLTLTGNDTPAHYATELSSVKYESVAGNPNSAARTATFRVFDILSNSAIGVQTINVPHVNQPPLLSTIESSPLVYAANHPELTAIPITSTLSVGDSDSSTLNSATVQITSGYQNDANGHDVLSVVDRFGITGSFDAASGTLTLTGSSSGGNYRTVLRSVTFGSSGSNVSTTSRVVTFTAFDDQSLSSNQVTRQIQVTNTNASPTLSGYSGTQAFTKGGATLGIAPGLVVNDSDSTKLASATISFTRWQVGDRLSFSNPSGLQHSFVEDLAAHTASLTFTGQSLVANYQSTLRSVGFYNVAGNPVTTARNVNITVNDGVSNSGAATGQVTVVV